jgi:hypothetical protein
MFSACSRRCDLRNDASHPNSSLIRDSMALDHAMIRQPASYPASDRAFGSDGPKTAANLNNFQVYRILDRIIFCPACRSDAR